MNTGMGKFSHKNTAKVNIPLRIAAVLLCLTLASVYSISGLFARYTTSVQSTDTARVAKFSIKGSGILSESIAAELAPGGTQEVPLVIENNSEVAVEYEIEVKNVTQNLPLSLSMVKTGGSTALVSNADGTKYTAQQLPGRNTDEYTLFITWSAAENDPEKMGMVDHISVTVTAAQTD